MNRQELLLHLGALKSKGHTSVSLDIANLMEILSDPAMVTKHKPRSRPGAKTLEVDCGTFTDDLQDKNTL